MDYIGTPDENKVWQYDQLAATIGGKVKPSTPGFCAGMCVVWIMLRGAGKDFKVVTDLQGWRSIDISGEQYNKIVDIQNSMEGVAGKAGYKKGFGATDFDVGKALRIDSKNEQFEGVQLERVAGEVAARTQEDTAWFILRMRNAKDQPGHVVAIEVRGAFPKQQTFRLMDPSNGCVEFVGEDAFNNWMLKNFFKAYVQFYKGYLKLHRIKPIPMSLNIAVLKFSSVIKSLKFG